MKELLKKDNEIIKENLKNNYIKNLKILNNSNLFNIENLIKKNMNELYYNNLIKIYLENYYKLESIFLYLDINYYEKFNNLNYNNLDYNNNLINYILDYILFNYNESYYINLNINNLMIIKRNDLKKYKKIINENLKYNNENILNFYESNFKFNNYICLNENYIILFNIFENVYFNNKYNLLNKLENFILKFY